MAKSWTIDELHEQVDMLGAGYCMSGYYSPGGGEGRFRNPHRPSTGDSD